MQSPVSRRAATNCFSFLSTRSCVAAEQRAVHHRIRVNTQASRLALTRAYQVRQERQLSTTPSRSPAAPSPSPTATGTPSTSTPTNRTTPPPVTPSKAPSSIPETEESTLRSLTEGLADPPPLFSEDENQHDWTRSFHGLSSSAFSPEQAEILMAPIAEEDIEVKPDGIIYLPEIKYRRILNRVCGPGGWGLAPRGETIVTAKLVTREYGLVCHGRLVSIARGEQTYFDPDGIPTATEGCKSNALMRCCKDLGIASELWDPRFIKRFMAANARELMVEHVTTKKRRKHFMRKDDELKYPWKEIPMPGATPAAAPAAAAKSSTSSFTGYNKK